LAQSDFKYGYQAAILENQLRAITPELVAGSAPNFNHRYIYLLRIFYGFFTRGEHNEDKYEIGMTPRQKEGHDGSCLLKFVALFMSRINPLKTDGILRNFKKLCNSPKSGRISKIMVPPKACLNTFQISTNGMGFQ
jgi:hypothetical protein